MDDDWVYCGKPDCQQCEDHRKSLAPDIEELERDVREMAAEVGDLESQKAAEWVRLTLTGIKDWAATQQLDIEWAPRIRRAEAEYQIALAALRRSECQ